MVSVESDTGPEAQQERSQKMCSPLRVLAAGAGQRPLELAEGGRLHAGRAAPGERARSAGAGPGRVRMASSGPG